MAGSYRVVSSAPVNAQLRAIGRAAVYTGHVDQVARAARQISQLLAHAPLGVGDPMYRLRGMKLRVRHIVVPPLYVEYGVHDSEPVVYLRFIASIRGSVDLS